MSIRKRNEYLDGDESEEETDHDYEDEDGRVGIGRSSKRRKTTSDSEASVSDEEEEGSRDLPALSKAKDPRFDFGHFTEVEEDMAAGAGGGDDQGTAPDDDDPLKPNSRSNKSMVKQYEKAQKAVRKSGLVYISRVPPFMKPHTLKHFLEPHASKGLNRIFLTPEDHEQHTKRVKSGGNKKKSFTDGWVEFNSKKEAKLAAETLNGNIIGGKKGGFYHDDLWNMKYLKGFKWHHLTEQISMENAERAARINTEIRKTRKENKAFVEDVERAKMLEGMEKKREAKRERDGVADSAADDTVLRRPQREFKQHKVRSKSERGDGETSAKLNSVLSKIF